MGRMPEMGLGADYYSLREENRVFEDVGAFDSATVNRTGVEKPEQLEVAQVTPSFFRVLGTRPAMGRYLAVDEEGTKAPPVVVASYGFWRSRMGGDTRAVGKTILLDRLPYTVIGVMPQGFDAPQGAQLWRPLDMDEAMQRPRSAARPMRMVNIVARLRRGVSGEALGSEMGRLSRALREEYPKEFERAGFLDRMAIWATPLQERLTGNVRPALLVLSGAVGLVLLIACANLANLLLARASARRREIAVRMALGSGRGRIVRQVLTESVALALPGGLAGIALAYLAVEGLNAWQPAVLQRYPAIAMDATTLVFTFGLTLITGLVFGMAPALAAAGVGIQEALKGGSHSLSGGRGGVRLRQMLVVAELAICLVLLIGAGLLARSFVKLAGTDLGFPAENLLTMKVNLSGASYATAEGQKRFYDEVLGRMRQLPMVRRAAVATDVPLSGGHAWRGSLIQVFGRAPVPMAQRPMVGEMQTGREFFATMGIPLRRGRLFEAGDTVKSKRVVVVNEALVRHIFANEEPVGRRIGVQGEDWETIMGVVGDIRGNELGAEAEPLIYRCDCQTDAPFLTRMTFVVRTAGDPRAAIRDVEGQVHAVDRNEPVFDVKTMEERLAASLAPQRFHLALIGAFAAFALVLAAVGVFGVMSYMVTRRTREIGIRVAMGATARHVTRLVVGESVALAALAAVAGLAGAWGATRYLKSMLYGVTALDGFTFAAMPVILLAVALAASFGPARRAVRIDPMAALREE